MILFNFSDTKKVLIIIFQEFIKRDLLNYESRGEEGRPAGEFEEKT